MRSRNKGFTLIEVMMSVAILSILVTGTVLTIQKGLKVMDSYSQIVTVNQMLTIRQGIDAYVKLYGYMPESPEDLLKRGVLVGTSEGISGIKYIIKNEGKTLVPAAVYPDGRESSLESILAISKIKYRSE